MKRLQEAIKSVKNESMGGRIHGLFSDLRDAVDSVSLNSQTGKIPISPALQELLKLNDHFMSGSKEAKAADALYKVIN